MKVIVLTTDNRAYIDDLSNHISKKMSSVSIRYFDPLYKFGMYILDRYSKDRNTIAESICKYLKNKDYIYDSVPCHGTVLLYHEGSDMTKEKYNMLRQAIVDRKTISKDWHKIENSIYGCTLYTPDIKKYQRDEQDIMGKFK